ncbi:hypothetical protein ACRCUN_15550 [Mycobacterium sp. LTG2003]
MRRRGASRHDGRQDAARARSRGVRRLVAVALLTAGPLVGVTTAMPAPVANACPSGIYIGLDAVGAPFPTNCDLVVEPPTVIGSSPSAGAIIACRDLPGCLSNYVNGNGPGYVKVPHRDTTVRQSQ